MTVPRLKWNRSVGHKWYATLMFRTGAQWVAEIMLDPVAQTLMVKTSDKPGQELGPYPASKLNETKQIARRNGISWWAAQQRAYFERERAAKAPHPDTPS